MRRRDLLAAAAAGALTSGLPLGRAAAATGGRKFLLVWVNGGWDVTYCMDPKLDLELIDGPEDDGPLQGAEEVRTFGEDLQILCNDAYRPAVSSFFEAYGDRVAAVNGIQVGSIGHDPARYRMLTGTSDPSRPDLSVMIGHALGAGLPLGSIDFSGFSLAGAFSASNGRVGANGQLKTLLDPYSVLPPASGLSSASSYPLFVPTDPAQLEQQAVLASRMDRYLASRGLGTESRRRIEAWFESQDRIARFRDLASELLASLELGSSPSFSKSLSLAVDLLAAGVCQTAFVDTGKLWDTHTDNTLQHDYYQALFSGLRLLMDRLYNPSADQAPLGSDITIVVMSEFTRTPRFNLDGGKDHWPINSVLLMGDGVRGGRTFGATTDELRERKVDLATGELTDSGSYLGFSNLAAGILELCDVDPQEWLSGVTPFRGAAT